MAAPVQQQQQQQQGQAIAGDELQEVLMFTYVSPEGDRNCQQDCPRQERCGAPSRRLECRPKWNPYTKKHCSVGPQESSSCSRKCTSSRKRTPLIAIGRAANPVPSITNFQNIRRLNIPGAGIFDLNGACILKQDGGCTENICKIPVSPPQRCKPPKFKCKKKRVVCSCKQLCPPPKMPQCFTRPQPPPACGMNNTRRVCDVGCSAATVAQKPCRDRCRELIAPVRNKCTDPCSINECRNFARTKNCVDPCAAPTEKCTATCTVPARKCVDPCAVSEFNRCKDPCKIPKPRKPCQQPAYTLLPTNLCTQTEYPMPYNAAPLTGTRKQTCETQTAGPKKHCCVQTDDPQAIFCQTDEYESESRSGFPEVCLPVRPVQIKCPIQIPKCPPSSCRPSPPKCPPKPCHRKHRHRSMPCPVIPQLVCPPIEICPELPICPPPSAEPPPRNEPIKEEPPAPPKEEPVPPTPLKEEPIPPTPLKQEPVPPSPPIAEPTPPTPLEEPIPPPPSKEEPPPSSPITPPPVKENVPEKPPNPAPPPPPPPPKQSIPPPAPVVDQPPITPEPIIPEPIEDYPEPNEEPEQAPPNPIEMPPPDIVEDPSPPQPEPDPPDNPSKDVPEVLKEDPPEPEYPMFPWDVPSDPPKQPEPEIPPPTPPPPSKPPIPAVPQVVPPPIRTSIPPRLPEPRPEKCKPYPPPCPQPNLLRRMKYCEQLAHCGQAAPICKPQPQIQCIYPPTPLPPCRRPIRNKACQVSPPAQNNCYNPCTPPPMIIPYNLPPGGLALNIPPAVLGTQPYVPQMSQTNVPNTELQQCRQHYQQMKALEEQKEFLKQQHLQEKQYLEQQQALQEDLLAKQLEALRKRQIHDVCEIKFPNAANITDSEFQQQNVFQQQQQQPLGGHPFQEVPGFGTQLGVTNSQYFGQGPTTQPEQGQAQLQYCPPNTYQQAQMNLNCPPPRRRDLCTNICENNMNHGNNCQIQPQARRQAPIKLYFDPRTMTLYANANDCQPPMQNLGGRCPLPPVAQERGYCPQPQKRKCPRKRRCYP